MNVKRMEIDMSGNMFEQMLEGVAKDYDVTIKRVVRTAKAEETFYFSFLTIDYLLFEIEFKQIKSKSSHFYGLPAFECSVEVF